MQRLNHILIASTILLSISTSWAATPITLPDPPRPPDQQPAPEVLPVPIPEPPRQHPVPSNNPTPMPGPNSPREMNRRPPPEATPITLP
ncbi:MAG: hypothetical protein AB8G77_28500 [Rhodothermales bacterium]